MNKNIVIIGGSSGIGLAASKLFLDNKDKVVNVSRTNSPIEEVVNINFDISKIKEIPELFVQIAEQIGDIDTLVYSAGFSMASPVEKVSTEDYHYLFDVNFFGAIESIKSSIEYLNPLAHIILVSSLGGVVPIFYDAYYSASKAALNMLVMAMQGELINKDISITSLLPGGTQTDFTFKRKIYPIKEMDEYAIDMQNAVNNLADIEQSGDSAKKVANDIFRISNMTKPPIIETVGAKNKLYLRTTKMVSPSMLNKICTSKYLKEKNKVDS
ncbi:MAG: SDR family NAD(P)-dependent oxidoreductase [Clostridia bacterium]